ncbi:MAG: zinc ribbon domain-containing protein [Gemmatimonadales bacterium]
MPDHLERLFRRLVANLAALDPAAIHRPVAIREIHERLVPYRTHRLALGLDTSEDYEMTLLRLCAGEQGWATTFPQDARAALANEATSVNPNTSLYRKFPEATLLLDPDRAAEVLAGRVSPPRAPLEVSPNETAEDPKTPAQAQSTADDEESDDSQLPFVLEEETEDETRRIAHPREVAAVTAPCPYCGGGLPVGRTVLFCPHCGQNIGVVHCPTCGSELDVGWQFCITCGQKVTGLG